MLCEGVHLYSKVVEVFSEGSKMKYYYALGWGECILHCCKLEGVLLLNLIIKGKTAYRPLGPKH